jgi:hypothetical protein
MDDLVTRFTYHPPKGGQPALYEKIRYQALTVAQDWDETAPDSREKSLAISHLEQAVMWINAAIARHG